MRKHYTQRVQRGGSYAFRWLLMFLLALASFPALATHFRYGSVSWVHVASPARTVKFVIKQAWRWDYPWPGGTKPAVNQVVTTGAFGFGDGSSTNVNLRVTSINVAENWFAGEVEITKTYAASARDTFTAVFQGCCKISDVSQFASNRYYQPLNRDGDYINITKVKLGLGNSSPVTSIPAYINLPTGSAGATYQLPATDPNGNPLRFYLTNTVPYRSPNNQTQPPGISIDSNGLLTMPTFRPVVPATGNYTGPYVATTTPYPLSTLIGSVQVPTMFNASVTIIDNQGAMIQNDFLIRIAGASTPPVFEYPTSAKPGPTPANGTTYVIHPGTPITFTVRAHDVDAGSALSLNASGVPSGATFTAQTTGGTDTAQSVFTWTPGATQFGSQLINITAQDNAGVQTSTIINIVVTLDPEFTGPGSNSTFCVVPGTTFAQTYGAFNSDPLRNVRIKSATGTPTLPAGLTFSSQSLPTSFGNPVSTTLSWTPAQADWGLHAITMQAENQTTLETSDHTVNLLVNTTPTITTMPVTSVYSGQLYSYTLSLNDPDIAQGDHVHLESSVLPAFLHIHDNHDGTYSIEGTPTFADAAGSPYSVQLRFHDHLNETYGTQCGMVTQNYSLTVNPCNVTVSDSTVNAACNSTSTGAIYLTVNNATAPVNYAWTRNGAAFIATTEDISNLQSGTYIVNLTDANGCSATDTFIVTEPPGVTLDATAQNTTCNGANGNVTAIVGNGTPPFTYSIDNGSTWTSNPSFGGLVAGSYVIQVREANNCISYINATLTNIADATAPVIATFTTPSSPVTISSAGRATTYTNLKLNAAGNVLAVAPGATVSISADWTSFYDGGAGCPGCVTQHYLGIGTTSIVCHQANSGNNGSLYATFTAPTIPGIYYINQVGMWCYTCGQCVPTDFGTGSANAVAVLIVGSPLCHADTTVNNDAGTCGATVPYASPSVADNCPGATIAQTAGLASNSIFAVGTTTNTFTATDASNLTSTCNFNVIVIDNEIPVITTNGNQSVNNDAGFCGANVTVSASVAENCAAVTATATRSDSQPLSARYPVGTTTVTWNATDVNGNAAAPVTQTVTVTDNQNPTISAPVTVTVATDANQCSATGVALGTPVTADNCGVASVTNNAPATFPKGTTTVTWTVRDVNNNTATATQNVIVEDRQNPTITAPANVTSTTSADGSGNCSTTATLGTPTTSDNCGVAGLTAKVGSMTINPATYAFPTGTTTVTWTASDAAGNTASAAQTVTVTDNEQPNINCPANVAQCFSAGGNTISLSVTSSDNCGVTATSYAITGATTGTGTGSSFSRNFALGTSTITWTVKDAANNSRSCTMTVTIRPLPTVTIAASTADEFCNATTLTASIAPAGTATYAWTYNNASFATTQSIKLKINNGDGAYRVVATDVYGCSSAPATYNFLKQTLINMYVLLGTKEVDLAQNNDVINGSVGVTSSHGEADFDKYCSVASTGSFVKAVDIDTKSPVTITTKIYSQAVVTLPTMYLNSSNPSSLSNYVMTTNGTVTGNKKDLTINSNKTVTITGNIFRKIRICHGADVTFTASDISMESLKMDQGSTVRFTGNTKLRVSDEVDVDKECSINPAAKIVTFYVKDPSAGSYNCWGNWSSWHSWSSGSSEKFIVDGKSTNIIANVYVPNGKIRVHGNGWNCWWNQYESCNMMGLFIAEEIEGDGKNISWYSYDCSTPASFRQAAHTAPIEEAADFGVMMYPNPTTGQFSLQFSNTAEAAQVRITDIQGRLISTRTVEIGEMPSAAFSIEAQAAGVYMVEIQQGAKTVRNRIVRR